MYATNGNKRTREESAVDSRVHTCQQKEKKMHAKHIKRWQLSIRSVAWLEGKTLPDGWDLLLHHHVGQVVVMLGQEESLDDRLSDLKGERSQNCYQLVMQ